MSCVCILTPAVIAAWPAISAATAAAATALGYRVVAESVGSASHARQSSPARSIQLALPHTEAVTDTLGRDQRIVVQRDDVTITFARDARGRTTLCVAGDRHTGDELRRLGEEMAGRVVQHYVHQKLLHEMEARGYTIAEQETDAEGHIRVKVRQWEN